MKGRLPEDLEWRKLLNGLNNVKVSKGMLGYSDTRHCPDQCQFLTTTQTKRVDNKRMPS